MQNTRSLPLPAPHSLANPPQIFKLFVDTDSTSSYSNGQLSVHSTLRQCFLKILPETEIASTTLAEYESTLNHWERLMGTLGVGLITKAKLKEFRDKLAAEKWSRSAAGKKTAVKTRSPATVNKIMRHLKAIVMNLFPPDRHNPEGLGLVPLCRFPAAIEETAKLPFTYSRAELSALYRNAAAARPQAVTRPSPLHRPELWRLAFVLGFGAGPRSWDLLRTTWDRIGWDDFQYGSIQFRAKKTKKLQRIPLSRVARKHLEIVRDLGLHDIEIFPMFKKSNRSFYRCWKRICMAAGIEAISIGRNPRFEDFRKTCSTAYDDAAPGVGPWITGHELQGVNAKSYQNPTKRVLKAVYRLKQPQAFREGAGLNTPAPASSTASN